MTKVYITGFESTPEQGGLSGWNWDFDEKIIDKTHKGFLRLKDCVVYRGIIEIHQSVSDKKEIEDFIEFYLETEGYEDAFEDKVYL